MWFPTWAPPPILIPSPTHSQPHFVNLQVTSKIQEQPCFQNLDGRETNMLRDRPGTNGCRSEVGKQASKKNKMVLRKEDEEKTKRKRGTRKTRALACVLFFPGTQLLLLRGRAPAVQIGATSNVRYRCSHWHRATGKLVGGDAQMQTLCQLLSCPWERQGLHILCATTSPATRSTQTGRNGTRQRHAVQFILCTLPTGCIHTAPGLTPSGHQPRPINFGTPGRSAPRWGRSSSPHSTHHRQKRTSGDERRPPGSLDLAGRSCGPVRSRQQPARESCSTPVASRRPNHSSDLIMANIGCTMYAECYRPTTVAARPLQSTA